MISRKDGMQELSFEQVEEVSGAGDIYAGADGWILVWGAIAVACVLTGGGGLALAGAVAGMLQAGDQAGAFN
jgi:hypothetical protein